MLLLGEKSGFDQHVAQGRSLSPISNSIFINDSIIEVEEA